jgi:methylmalonyl-CoA mutase, N-terminal domain
VLRGIEEGWFQGEIAQASADFERKLNDGRRVLVGVNRFVEPDEDEPVILYIGPEAEEQQRKRLGEVKRRRQQRDVESSLARVRSEAARSEVNLMPALLDAVRAHATIGEIVGALASVFGTWTERPAV